MKISTEEIEKARQVWIKASQILDFKLITPYEFTLNGSTTEVFGLVPDYGTENGMLIGLTSGPEFYADEVVIQIANSINCGISFLNIEDFLIFNKSIFLELLSDWSLIKE